MIDQHSSYKGTDSMRDLLRDNSMLLLTTSRFGIGFGFGDETVKNVCRLHDVDCDTFLSVANLLSCREHVQYHVDLPTLMNYLRRTHRYYLEVSLPKLRHKIIDAISSGGAKDISLMLIKFFDDYVIELKNHLDEENDRLFPFISGLLQQKVTGDFSLTDFQFAHTPVTDKLQELKDIFIYHYSNPESMLMAGVLFDIVNLEHDLVSHFEVEDHLLLPAVKLLESEVKKDMETEELKPESSPLSALGEREKEIIGLIARGLSNKEIADQLCLSVHTVATHRKNIISKLQIHSTSGLTIFAILHGLIDISDVSL